MKKWMNYIMVIGLTAGSASAAWWPFGSDKKDEVVPAVPVVEAVPAPAHGMPRIQRPEGQGERQRPQITPEQMEKMKAQHEELMKLGEAARKETDPAKKEILVGQLRVKLTEVADKMQAEGKKRLEQAEKELPRLREKLAEAEKNKAARIEEQVQRILAGEPLKKPEGKRPEGAELKKEVKKATKPAVKE
jgi:hypothetical protein